MDEREKQLFLQLVQENKERIYSLCRAYTRNEDDRQDLFQEVLFNVWKSIETFRGDAQINTWLYRITLNVCMRYSLRLTQPGKVRLEGLQFLNNEANAEQNLEQQEKIDLLYACINKLNEVDKTVILLYLEDLSYKEIGAITGLTENTIAKKVSRIKGKLFQCFKSCDYAE